MSGRAAVFDRKKIYIHTDKLQKKNKSLIM